MSLTPGTRLGPYEIAAQIGEGGMGEVYRAIDTNLKRAVALKVLPASVAADAERLARFQREAEVLAALNHPHIAQIYGLERTAGTTALVLELVEGPTLADRLLNGPLPVAEALRIANQIAEALDAAHEQGILHRDLKPANIKIKADGTVKVLDFGLAKVIDPRPLSPALSQSPTLPPLPVTPAMTRAGIIMGTPAYMAPEAILEAHVDGRADIFSFGVLLYEMLSGQNPFVARGSVATFDRILHESPAPIDRVASGVPPPLSRLVQHLIEKDQTRRCATVAELRQGLARVQLQPPSTARRRLVTRALPAAVGAAFVIVAAALWPVLRDWRARQGSSSDVPSNVHLAVLPFSESTAGGNGAFFTQGLTEAINARLSRLTVGRRLQVTSLADIRARAVTTPTEARQQLGANVALTGSLAYAGGRVEATCVLIDTRTGRALRSETTATAGDPLALQDRVVEVAVRMLNLDLTPAERRQLIVHETTQPGAYDFYLQARGYLLNFDRLENLDSAIAVFRRALEADRRYAPAYAGLGEAYWRKHELTGSSAWVEPARAACEGALGLDANLAEPHACLGMVLAGTGEYERAASEYTEALSREPTNDVLYLGLATAYDKLDRHADAEAAFRRGIELRPYYWGGYNMLAAYYYRAARYDDALKMFQQVVDLAPDSYRSYSALGATYFMKDDTANAIAAFEKSLAIRPNYTAASNLGTLLYFDRQYARSVAMFRQALALEKGSYQVWGNLAAALELAGSLAEAKSAHQESLQLVDERLRVNPRDASLHVARADRLAALGDLVNARAALARAIALTPRDAHTMFAIAVFYEQRLHERTAALTWMERALAAGQTWKEIDNEPSLGELRRDPGFATLRARHSP